MPDRSVLRLLHFRPVDPGATVDTILRNSVLPDLRRQVGLIAVLCGRQQGTESADARVVASVWESDGTMHSALGSAAGELDPWLLADAIEPRVEVLTVAVDVRSTSEREPTVLRILRGEVRDGALDAYEAEIARATAADVDADRGPVALFVGAAGPTTFVTVSSWTDWSAIADATGGSPMLPLHGRFSDRLVRSVIDHYEILPNADSVAANAPR